MTAELTMQERLDAALHNRLDALLTKHEGELYADWKRDMTERPEQKMPTIHLEVAALLLIAVFSGVHHRFPELGEDADLLQQYIHRSSKAGRVAARNERLLLHLIVRGFRLRGEL